MSDACRPAPFSGGPEGRALPRRRALGARPSGPPREGGRAPGRLLAAAAVFLAGCGQAASDNDGRMIVAEQARLHMLADPATLAAAQRPPAPPPDGGRWAGPTTRRPPAATRPALSLTIEQAVLMALAGNRNLVVQRIAPQVSDDAEQGLYGQFDPALTGQASFTRQWPGPGQLDFKDLNAQTAVTEFFPTGTTAGVSFTADDGGEYLYGDKRDDEPNLTLGLTVTQQLIRGASVQVNLAVIRQAQLDVLSSQYELRGLTETLAATVEQAYITYLQDDRVLHIAESALTVAQNQLGQTDAMVASGRSAASDRPAAAATVAQRREDLINARSTLEQARLTLLQLINAPSAGEAGGWTDQVRLVQPPVPTTALDDVDAHVRVALLYRSDLNQARLQAERGELSVVATRDGLLPQLALFANLGRTWVFHAPVSNNGGLATTGNTVTSTSGKVIAAAAYENGAGENAQVGVNFSYPLGNRAAQASFRSALATRQQADLATANLSQQVELDVRSAYQEVVRAREQITATTATLAARQASLDVERERFTVGRSTNLLVSVAEQDVLNTRIDQATAIAAYLNGLVNLYRSEGSLLERRGVITTDSPPQHKR